MPVKKSTNSREKSPPYRVWLEMQEVIHFDEQNNHSFTKVEMNLLNFSRTGRNPPFPTRRVGHAALCHRKF